MSEATPQGCPEPLRRAFLDLLGHALVYIRFEPDHPKLCFAHADHLHNIPDVLADFRPRLLAYYWEVERPCFLRALSAIDRQPPSPFHKPWEVVEAEYRRLCRPGSP